MFISQVIAGALLAGVTGALGSGMDERDQPAIPDSSQNLFVLNGQRVLVIRLRILIDGQTPLERQAAWCNSVFASADGNGDGYLTENELTVDVVDGLGMMGDPWALDDAPTDERLSVEEIRRWLVQSGSSTKLQTDFQATAPADQPLLRTLDKDGNGSLTRAEAEGAFDNLRKRDINDSESLSAQELAPDARVVRNGAMSQCDFMLVPIGTVNQELLSVLSRRAKDGGVRGKDLRLYGSSSRLKSVDYDGNRILDRNELMQFIRSPQPDVELLIKADTATGSLSVSTEKDLTGRVEVRVSEGWSRIVIGQDVEISLVARHAVDPLKVALNVFTSRDRDRNGYLDEGERKTFPLPQVSSFDSDGDGNVFREEFEAGIRLLVARAGAQIDVAIDRRGRSLFAAIDADRNQRLSRREFASLNSRIGAWDTNGNGGLEASEIPESYQFKIGTGLPPFIARRAITNGRPGESARPRFGQPVWMQRLDRNGDGELSRREFPGSNMAFDRLDANRDGVVDQAEALRATSEKEPPRSK